MARTAHKRPAAQEEADAGVKSEGGASQASAKRPRTSEANAGEELPPAPGSVLKVKMRNFMTYSNVEFAPGRRLNLILGPNGAPAAPAARSRMEGSSRVVRRRRDRFQTLSDSDITALSRVPMYGCIPHGDHPPLNPQPPRNLCFLRRYGQELLCVCHVHGPRGQAFGKSDYIPRRPVSPAL